jgi:hypothetical protein
MAGGTYLTGCVDKGSEPTPSGLTAEEQRFANIFKPNADGSSVSIQISV